MRYSCTKLISAHLPIELYQAVNDLADTELLSRSQIVRDALLVYLSNRQATEPVNIRATRDKLLDGVWGKLFSSKG